MLKMKTDIDTLKVFISVPATVRLSRFILHDITLSAAEEVGKNHSHAPLNHNMPPLGDVTGESFTLCPTVDTCRSHSKLEVTVNHGRMLNVGL